MTFDPVKTADCVIPQTLIDGGGSGGAGGSGGGAGDARCNDAAFAAANPSTCGSQSYLVIKPSSALIKRLSSAAFIVFEYVNGVESQVTDNLDFTSSAPNIFLIGASSGSGTGLDKGQSTITVTRNGLTASATITVLDDSTGCSTTVVKSLVLIDNSRSTSLSFGGSYITRLDFAKAAAKRWASNIILVDNVPKDSVKVWSFAEALTDISSDYVTDTDTLGTEIDAISQLLAKTDIFDPFNAAMADLIAATADEKIIVLISDGEQTTTADSQPLLTAAAAFKAAGGIIVVIGLRASGNGFDLLERVATGGFFINATSANAESALEGLSFLKSVTCAGTCTDPGDGFANQGAFNYSSFRNWEVISGTVDLCGNGFCDFLPGNGLYVDMVGTAGYIANNTGATIPFGATIRSIDRFALAAGVDYTIKFRCAGNNRLQAATGIQSLKVFMRDPNAPDTDPNIFEHVVSPSWDSGFQTYSFTFTAPSNINVKLYFQQILAVGQFGNLLDSVTLTDSNLSTMLTDNFDTENPLYVLPACGQSKAITAISDPPAPAFVFVDYAGANVKNGDTYKYAISYMTAEGETALSPLADSSFIDFTAAANKAIKVTMQVPTEPRVLSKRLWRNKATGSSTLYLLASFDPGVPTYFDTENHTTFSGRVDTGIVAPVANTTAKAEGFFGYGIDGCCGDNIPCPACSQDAALLTQFQDPNPLPDVETGTITPQLFTSTKTQCVSCQNGQTNQQANSLVPFMTSPTAPSGIVSTSSEVDLFFAWKVFAASGNNNVVWIANTAMPQFVQYKFDTAQSVQSYALTVPVLFDNGDQIPTPKDWVFEASNDGSTWTALDTQQGKSIWYDGERNIFKVTNPDSYLYYRVRITAANGGATTLNRWTLTVKTFEMFAAAPVQSCQSATAQSYISQQDADSKATAAATLAAQSLLNCVQVYTSTQSYTATCPLGNGSPVTKNATVTSFASQAAADADALAQAKALALTAIQCSASNNTQQITINDNANATPYPSVKSISGQTGVITKVTVSLKKLSHTSPNDIVMLLVGPDGTTTCLLMSHCGNSSTTINADIVLDDSAGSHMPISNAGPLVAGTFKPTQTVCNNFPAPAPTVADYSAYGTTLSVFNGKNPNGNWALYVVDSRVLDFGSISQGWDITVTSA